MKKLGRVLFLATVLSSIMSVSVFAQNEKPESSIVGPKVRVISVHETEEAKPINPLFRKVPLSYGWSLDVDAGLIQGVDANAESSSFVTGNPSESHPIDYMYLKIDIKRTSGGSYDDTSDTNTSNLSLYLNDGSAALQLKTAKSTHTFKNAGYADSTKYVTKNIH